MPQKTAAFVAATQPADPANQQLGSRSASAKELAPARAEHSSAGNVSSVTVVKQTARLTPRRPSDDVVAPVDATPNDVKLADALVRQGIISSAQMSSVLARQRSGLDTHIELPDLLIKMGYIDSEQLAKLQADQSEIAIAAEDDYGPASNISANVLALIPGKFAHKYCVIPVGLGDNGKSLKMVAASWESKEFDICRTAAAKSGLSLAPLTGSEELIRSALARYYPHEASTGATATPPKANGVHRIPAAPKPKLDDSADKNDNIMSNEPPKRNIHAVPAVVDPRKSATPARVTPVDRRASDVLSGSANPAITFAGQTANRGGDENVDINEFSMDQPAIIQMVNKLIADAIHQRASDIHFEPVRDGLTVKYRIDGTLCDWDKVPKGFANACTSRLKVMSDMNIAERRVPQDGRITVKTGGRTVDMRVSSLPTQYGEAVVLRILDRTAMRLDVNHLGFGDRNLKTLHNVIKRPHGIFLATGPTGSGKTTTLYGAIHAIQSPDINIITVEDPIEYELEGVRQSNTNEKAGLTFAKQLRAILRQDPDVIYVGEIRDAETAEIGFRAALTGHLVFSTLHCNEASAAITRLLNMGMDPFLIASSVIGVLAQRLVRKVCKGCAQPYTPTVEELGLLGLDPASREVREANFMMGSGCDACNGSGYAGRCSVQELMVMDENIRALTLERATATKIRQVATTMGTNPMIPMRRDAAVKVMQGLTTCAEVQKRVMLDDD